MAPSKNRPATSGYARLAQADEDREFEYESDEDPYAVPPTLSSSVPRYAPIRPTGHMQASRQSSPSRYRSRRPYYGKSRRGRTDSSGVDIKAINMRLEKWAEEIASKFKIHRVKGKTNEEEQLEIHHTVFQAPEGVRPVTAASLEADPPETERMAESEFNDIVESVRVAIELGVHPKMISQGSSGSYFARNSEGKVVGVFKPKDEEPYASRNPKWTKWIHRNLFPCFFGRACLIPNLSYVSEAAAYVLDTRLKTHLVPYTDIVWLSSKSFYYDFWDRRRAWRGKKPLPAKQGSFQVFLKGYKDANIFLREHPWPDQTSGGFRAEDAPRRKKRPWNEACRPSGIQSDDEDEYQDARMLSPSPQDDGPRKFYWTENLKQSFREELEKLVILDYIMRNTDRGLDNWMIKVDWHTEEVSIVSDPPKANGINHLDDEDHMPPPRPISANSERTNSPMYPYRRHEAMVATSRTGTPSNAPELLNASISVGAIDNSLSWPWKHPDAWRSFPFGWLFLPVSLIGQPFSPKTRDHFLPLLTSTAWWSGTQTALRRVFSQDSDFKESMFARQIAVMKGQAWNVVETLKQADHGPLELTRRTRVCVWDDLVDIPVAIPLRVPSGEAQRRRALDHLESQEEMDISSAMASEPGPHRDLLSFGSPTNELPNPNRFELSRDTTSFESGRTRDRATSPISFSHADFGNLDRLGESGRELASSWATLPTRPTERQSKRYGKRPSHRKQASMSRRDSTIVFGGDDLEGDLGYAAAEEMEGHERKVIVERLEAVKSKNPVFTWC
ncbi:phosphatidylinositol 4-kinase type II subunit alpha [Coccidioides immitis RS]|uniref:Phosphatidylinositol 4-kinase n=1 Tax=Coccidioides immitis (strain RS) TaxID=246410 RepID=A0A0E1RXH7_COCIM|nr:phosphatidylinositol 4-kinase type II subunit alpha [Coccidioides immitis RS]EAS34019.1 phosphatidylinositol 4-kinase type II subunit alpha [Coccidioides immitis RS]TPX21615.1 phosphatidyl inositol kinase [Coccidioides immitis]